MVITLFGTMVSAEGDPMELATYTAALMTFLKAQVDAEQTKRDEEFLKQFGDFSIMDLIKREMESETGHQAEDGTGGQQRKRVPKPKRDADGADRMES